MSIHRERFTATQQRFLQLLNDGERHHWKEFVECLSDNMAGKQAVNQQMFHLRKLLPNDRMIITEVSGPQVYYRMCRPFDPNAE